MNPIKLEEIERLRCMAYEHQAKGNFFLAEQVYQILLNLETLAFGPDSTGAALYLYRLGELKILQHQKREAQELMNQAIAIWESNFPSDYVSLLSYTDALSKVDYDRVFAPLAAYPMFRKSA